MAATLRDVAVLAGVSVKTVSNVVNGYASVNRRTVGASRRRWSRPSTGRTSAPATCRRGRTGFLALMVPELGIPYFGELAALVITAAHAREWNVLIEQTRGTRELERSTLASLGPHLIDGAIISPEALHADDLRHLRPRRLDGHARRARARRGARPRRDRQRPGREEGRDPPRRAGPPAHRLLRRQPAPRHGHPATGGYRAALTAAGLPVVLELVAPAAKYHRRDGAEAMRALLTLPKPPDAVPCFNELLAVGALRAAAEHGRQVPDDLAVVGFDGSEEGAYTVPR